MEGKVESLSFGGFGVVKSEGKVFFISGALPEETIEFNILSKKKDVYFGEVKKIIEPSLYRREPKCEHFLICGGCHFQNLSYERQLEEKENILRQTLKKIGKIDAPFEKPIFGKEYNYRNKVEFKIGLDGRLGFFKRNSNELVSVKSCPVLSKALNNFLKNFCLKNMSLPGAELLTIYHSKIKVGRIKLKNNNLKKIFKALKEFSIEGLWESPKRGFGKYFLKRKLENKKLYHSPFSFMQINEEVNKLLIKDLLNILKDFKDLKVLEPYAGVGNFSLPLALNSKIVYALEPSKSNFFLLNKNKKENHIENLFVFDKSFEEFNFDEKFDLVLIDPPREGLTKEAIEKIISLKPKFLIYISCNPSTLARDLRNFLNEYKIEFVKLIDMFPQTYHIESLASLKLL